MTPETLEGYIHTLEICAKSLPGHAHPDHYRRIRDMQDYFKRLPCQCDRKPV